MGETRIAPTDDRRVVGVMNEFAFHGDWLWKEGRHDLGGLSLRLSSMIIGKLEEGSPDRALSAFLGGAEPMGKVIAYPGRRIAPVQSAPAPAPGAVFQLKVTLLDTKPPIWRRVLVAGDCTLDRLHEVIQAAFGWWDYHLHEFQVGPVRYGVPNRDWDWGEPPQDERRTRLDAIASEGMSFRYTYDFGDNWEHKITLEKVLSADSVTTVPACIDGRRACPPEDCGGTWGYGELLQILADPTHPDPDERRAWIGGPFDPEAFDPSEFESKLEEGRLAVFDDEV